MPTLGNHEVLLQESYDAWIARMALPTSQTDNFNIYSFDVGQVHFVSILAVRGAADLPDSQVDWIISDVQAARARGQTWIIPYMHVSAFADGSSHPSNTALRDQLGPVFEQLGVKLVISSHDQNYERTFPLTGVGQGSPVVTDTHLTGYDANDGTVWLKVSPAGKLSSSTNDFSTFQTNPPPYWTAARDDTMHHFARFLVSAHGALTTQIYATPGNGTASFVYDSFTYSLGVSSVTTAQTMDFEAQTAFSDRVDTPSLREGTLTDPVESSARPAGMRLDSTHGSSHSPASVPALGSLKPAAAPPASFSPFKIYDAALEQLVMLAGRTGRGAAGNPGEPLVNDRAYDGVRRSAPSSAIGPFELELALELFKRVPRAELPSLSNLRILGADH
jgi:hypothetical protein